MPVFSLAGYALAVSSQLEVRRGRRGRRARARQLQVQVDPRLLTVACVLCLCSHRRSRWQAWHWLAGHVGGHADSAPANARSGVQDVSCGMLPEDHGVIIPEPRYHPKFEPGPCTSSSSSDEHRHPSHHHLSIVIIRAAAASSS
eukprot:782111-Rhodomonas_salina.3